MSAYRMVYGDDQQVVRETFEDVQVAREDGWTVLFRGQDAVLRVQDRNVQSLERLDAPDAADAERRDGRPTVGEVMRPVITTVERDAHLAAATYLFKQAGDSALVVVDDEVGMVPIAVITDADVAQAVADGRDPNDVRINSVVRGEPMTVARETSVAEAADLMLSWQLTHLPVVDGVRLVGIVDMNAVCRGLLATRAGR